jgi:hypothetical protein
MGQFIVMDPDGYFLRLSQSLETRFVAAGSGSG